MINANELRIGNLLLDEKKGTFHEVTNIYKNGGSADYHYPLHWYAPIPLTHEILEKCGFEYSWDGGQNEANYSVKKKGKIVFSINDSFMFRHSFYNSTKFQYLHQLQNLYFALTGKELNYTP